MNFKKEAEKLIDAYENIEKYEVDLTQPIMPTIDFHKSRQNLYLQEFISALSAVQKAYSMLDTTDEKIKELGAIINELGSKDNEKIKLLIMQLKEKLPGIEIEEERSIDLPVNIPSDIYPEIEVDVNELTKCFNSGCFRSVVIICGRILEVALHRKYYEATQNDLLEKSPGIGLGNLIAKMKEKDIEFDPGITQQIHLINQVRIFSVHKKQQPFYPSRAQAQAMMLYTIDVLEKLFP